MRQGAQRVSHPVGTAGSICIMTCFCIVISDQITSYQQINKKYKGSDISAEYTKTPVAVEAASAAEAIAATAKAAASAMVPEQQPTQHI